MIYHYDILLIYEEVNLMSLMTKRVLINLPARLYASLRTTARKEYKSVSGLVRELILQRIEEPLTKEERALIERGLKEFRQGKGVDWEKIRRG